MDKKLCDLEGGNNQETIREFIRNSEKEFGIESIELETLDLITLNNYISNLDYLWTK